MHRIFLKPALANYRYVLARFIQVCALTLMGSCDSGGVRIGNQTSTHHGCVDELSRVTVCPASDMAKIAKNATIRFEHSDLDWSNGPVQLHAARNETVALQLVLHKTSNEPISAASLTLNTISRKEPMNAAAPAFSQSVFSAFYHPIDNAGYTWGPKTPVMPWPAEYPDALVPSNNVCGSAIDQREHRITFPKDKGDNQTIFIDTYVPKQTLPGVYTQNLTLSIDGNQIDLPIDLHIYSATMPDKPSINAVAELYRTYSLEGAGKDITSMEWRSVSQCYQQFAHAHRMVFIERVPKLLSDIELVNYADTINPAMTGELFNSASGYIGPGENTPVGIWKTPWPQSIDAGNTQGISNAEIEQYKGLAEKWTELVSLRNWPSIDYFAYIFDEVDGPDNTGSESETRDEYITRVHTQMAQVQSSIDLGSPINSIDLLWTSHSNPSEWQGIPSQDLTGIVRLWAPNASAADVNFLQERTQAGEKAWFYHSGHPAVGAHSINVSGIEMRTWGVIGARYGFQGQFMWAVNLGSDDFPFRDPQYRPDEDRAGNGVMVYPGNQLDKIGYEKSPGPVPSMRLKAWRRGLQDAELYYLAKEKSTVQADSLIQSQIPAALGDGQGTASWSNNTGDWIDFHKTLLELASTP